jgi:aspartyl-tRNA(Asn)/glutamyl-tRNA(Gln) amidotransferase subunit A
MLGKLNCDEFAMGSSNETSAFRAGGLAVAPPWLKRPRRRRGRDRGHAPGAGRLVGRLRGRGGGAAVPRRDRDRHRRLDPTARGLYRTVGIKPTYGRCSRWGTVAFASSLDQAGPIARTVRDCAILLRSMAGPDPKDTTSADIVVPDFEAAVSRGVRGLTIGIPKEYRLEGMAPEIDKLWSDGTDWLKRAGAKIVEVSLPHTKYALPAYYIVAPAEASSNLARYDGVRYGLRVPGAT